jgi:hypothetical protein
MKINRQALPLLIIAIVTLACGVLGGLLRMGWGLPLSKAQLMAFHGPLMVCGFLGIVVSLERAVAIYKLWAYLAPAFTGIGAAGIILGLPFLSCQWFILAGSIILLIIFINILRLESSIHNYVMLAGVLCWIIGNILWLSGTPINYLVTWWMAFLLFTITGERLELSRLGNIPVKSRNIFLGSGGITILGLVSSFIFSDSGVRIFGAGLLCFTFWLVNYDIARRTVKSKGITCFMAVCLLSGYFWLAVSGLVAIYAGNTLIGSYWYDAFLHSFFLGFTFSMIFGHAPVIFPAVLKIQMNYSSRFYSHLILLHLSLLVRVSGGLLNNWEFIKTGGMLNALTLLLFLVNTVSSLKILGYSSWSVYLKEPKTSKGN